MLCEFKNVLNNSVKTLNPSLIAKHIYELVKMYNSYYQTHTILGDKSINSFRVFLSEKVAFQIKKSMSLLGVSVPDRM
jgi:arginyl-tRNA synthetase